ASGPRSFEVRVTVTDRDGAAVDSEVALTDLFSGSAEVVLACRPGAGNVVRAELVGVYEGRPRAPRGGAGGLPIPETVEPAVATFRCPDDGATAEQGVSLTSGASAWELSAPTTVTAAVALPAALAGHEVDLWWRVAVERPDLPAAARFVTTLHQRLSVGRDVAFGESCVAPERSLRVTAEVFVVTVDGEALPRDAWRVTPIARALDCPSGAAPRSVTADVALELLTPPEASP
ncbi:MAG: hypothetical protein KC635_17990, partial [Myxococcales bacterium]|nr:hypothetical protein [Myxococcales bacterium]